jgi:predicted nucleic acid-binding protein
MEIVYIETSVVSFLVSSPSRLVETAWRQKLTRDWWRLRRPLFHCVTSDAVLAEAREGDATQSRLRLEVLAGLTTLRVNAAAETLAEELVARGLLPAGAGMDALHLALATVYRADYLLTWNCKHLANAVILRQLHCQADKAGCRLPEVCTPQQLMGDLEYED